MTTTGLSLLHEARAMLSAGAYRSSYEDQILTKLDKAIAEIEGNEVVDVRFVVKRDDLVALLTEGGETSDYMNLLSKPIAEYATSDLLSITLQQALYDSSMGPSLEGEYHILSDKTVG